MVIRIASIRWVIYHALQVVRSNNSSIWHRFRDITTFSVYVTAGCDLEKSFVFEKIVGITSRVRFRYGLTLSEEVYATCRQRVLVICKCFLSGRKMDG